MSSNPTRSNHPIIERFCSLNTDVVKNTPHLKTTKMRERLLCVALECMKPWLQPTPLPVLLILVNCSSTLNLLHSATRNPIIGGQSSGDLRTQLLLGLYLTNITGWFGYGGNATYGEFSHFTSMYRRRTKVSASLLQSVQPASYQLSSGVKRTAVKLITPPTYSQGSECTVRASGLSGKTRGARFESRSWDRLPWLRLPTVSLSPCTNNRTSTRLGHDSFLPDSLFINHATILRYIELQFPICFHGMVLN
jgi:hypothetical protein